MTGQLMTDLVAVNEEIIRGWISAMVSVEVDGDINASELYENLSNSFGRELTERELGTLSRYINDFVAERYPARKMQRSFM